MFDDTGKVYLIDLGMCKNYLRNGQHIAPKNRSAAGIIGTANYISVNVHQMKDPSRRDDVESVCYVLWKMCGGLNWGMDSTESLSSILEKKLALLQMETHLPPELLALLQNTRSLDFYDEPCYLFGESVTPGVS